MPAIVILGEAKNLVGSGTYPFEILRLTPQNDVCGIDSLRVFSPIYFLLSFWLLTC
jgi:hypothetical protein